MKRKRLDRDIWTDILEKTYRQQPVCAGGLDGIVSLLTLDRVDRPSLWDTPCGETAVCEAGMLWVQYLPSQGDCLITAMLNPARDTVLYYIDIIAGHGFAEDGVVFYDDLYLDIVIHQDGSLKVDDEAEFEEAFAAGDIDEALYRRGKDILAALLGSRTVRIAYLHGLCREGLRLFGERADSPCLQGKAQQ